MALYVTTHKSIYFKFPWGKYSNKIETNKKNNITRHIIKF